MSDLHGSTSTHELFGVDVDALLASTNVPGCSVAVLAEGGTVSAWSFGATRQAESPPVDERTLFQACSISKAISVVAALRAVDRGAIDLDTDVNQALTRWKLPVSADLPLHITLRMLASHTAGLVPHGFAGYPAGAPIPQLEQILRGATPANSPAVTLDLDAVNRFKYSGGGTTVIELLLEEITGRTAPEVLATDVLEPLGMDDSTFVQPLASHLVDQAASGHDAAGSEVAGGWHTYPEHCAAGLWTTSSDLLTFARAIQDAAKASPGSLLSTRTVTEMLRPHASLAPDTYFPGFTDIGLGLFLRASDEGRTTWFGHSGGNAGYRCLLIGSTDGRGAVVMTNGDNGDTVVRAIISAVAVEHGWDDLDLG